MNSSNLENKEEKKEKKKTNADTSYEERDQNRVVIIREANAAIEDLAKKVNDGFDGGTITKSDVANYVFINLSKFISETDVKAIRTLHFDERKVLGSLLRTDDDLPEELKRAIRAHYGIADKEKKRSSRASVQSPMGQSLEGAKVLPDPI